MTQYLDLDGKPDQLINPVTLRLPKKFLAYPPPLENESKFPFSKLDAVCLHVAACYRGVDLNNIDFAFGGSTLEMLATCNASDPFFVTCIAPPSASTTKKSHKVVDPPSALPSKKLHKVILVMKTKEYTKNLNDVGFQFEHLMTGQPLDISDTRIISSVEHLHVMNVGTHHVFFRAETDATDDECSPIEIKANNPRYWGTNVMFQMISSGSIKLCHGQKGRGGKVLDQVSILPLHDVARKAMGGGQGTMVQSLEKNILKGMDSLIEQMSDAAVGDVFKVTFQGYNSLKRIPVRGRSAHVLPPPDVIRDLLLPING